MSLALKEAWKYQGLTFPNPAVGCLIVGEKSEILAIEAHQKSGNPHAEVMALKSAYFKLTKDSSILHVETSSQIHSFLLKNHNGCFRNISIFTTLEPCSHVGKTPSCATLIASLGVKKVYVGTLDSNKEASCGNSVLQKNLIDVEVGVLEKECDDLLEPFVKIQKNNFIFFKWAQRLDGTTDNGIVSSLNSRKNVHAMRNVCDLLVIGGNTVRIDRPILDARLVDGKAPDILILSQKKEFDKSIPLFNVQGRKVFIENSFSQLENYKNIMIEGSSKMYELSKEIVDYYLCYLAPSFGGVNGFTSINDKFEILNIHQEEQDIIMWMKRENK